MGSGQGEKRSCFTSLSRKSSWNDMGGGGSGKPIMSRKNSSSSVVGSCCCPFSVKQLLISWSWSTWSTMTTTLQVDEGQYKDYNKTTGACAEANWENAEVVFKGLVLRKFCTSVEAQIPPSSNDYVTDLQPSFVDCQPSLLWCNEWKADRVW